MKLKLNVFTLLILSSCASPQSPTGGEKDINAPTLFLDSSVFRTNSNPNSLNFVFNENISLNKNEIEINPSVEPSPIYKIKNKAFSIYFPGSLKSNTTYSIRLNQAVKDVNEGNIGKYPTLLFSTGPTIDSNNLQLSIFGKSEKDQISLSITDSSNTYFYKTMDNQISISSSPKSSSITCWLDKNNNNIFDPLETGNIVKRSLDSLSIVLISANNYLAKQVTTGQQTLIYNLPIQEFKKSSALKFKDTIILTTSTDTNFSKFVNLSSSIEAQSNYLSFAVKPRLLGDSNTFTIEFNQPIQISQIQRIILSIGKDTITKRLITQPTKNQIKVTTPISFKGAEIIIPANSIKYQDSFNKTLKLSILQSDLASIEFINTQKESLSIILHDKNLNIVDVFILLPGQKIQQQLKPGIYSATTFIDLDNNGYLNHPIGNGPRETAKVIENILANVKLLNTINL